MKKTIYPLLAVLMVCSPALAMATEQKPLNLEEQDAKAMAEMFPEDAPSEGSVYRADRLLISATGSEKPVRLAPSVASVVTMEEIEQMGARTLNEVLETVPGLHVYPSNKNVMDNNYSIRGIHTSINPQTLFLVNGIPANMTVTGARPPLFQMPVSMISRVEVVRGPGSAVHGADAFSGVINVITKDGKEIDGLHGGARYGSFDSVDGWTQYGSNLKGWDVALSLDYMSSQGDKDRGIGNDLQGVLDRALGTNASLAPGALDTSYDMIDAQLALRKNEWNMRLWGWKKNNAGVADGVTQTLSDDSRIDNSLFRIETGYDNNSPGKDWGISSRLSYQYTHYEARAQLFPDGAVLPIGADGNIDFTNPTGATFFPDGVIGIPVSIENRVDFETALNYEGFAQQKWRLAAGLNYTHFSPEETKNFGPSILDTTPTPTISTGVLTEITDYSLMFSDQQERTDLFLSAQDEWAFARGWELTAGVRYDYYSNFGSTINPRAALVWETSPQLTSKLLYGRAFRAPSFNELYVQNNPSNNGNPDLDPETIDTYELAFIWEPANSLTMGTNFFYYDIKDLIELVQDPGQTTLTSQNAKDQDGYGFELEAAWQALDTLQFKGNMAFQHSEDTATGERVADAPGLQLYLTGNWQFRPNHSLDIQYFWIGDRERGTGDTREDINDYSLVNLTLHRTNIAENWDVTLAARNIFDKNIREPSQAVITDDYPMEGRSFWAEVSFHY